MFLFIKGQKKYVRTLEDNLMNVVAELGIYYSRKKIIDDKSANQSSSKVKTNEYHILQTKIDGFYKRYRSFVEKYNKYVTNLPVIQVITDFERLENVIEVMKQSEENKPTILTLEFFKLAELSKKIKELYECILLVSERMNNEDNLLCDKKVEAVDQIIHYEDAGLPSFKDHVAKILSYLGDDDNKSIGILGPPGGGKTTLMKDLNNELMKKKSFDVVIWIEYDKEKDAIQHAIKRLELEVQKETNAHKNSMKYVLLIDQVSSNIDLNEVFIPKYPKFGKFVVASSSKEVIRSMDQHVEIKRLSDDDALELFKKLCGSIQGPRIENHAKCILKLCGGLPLPIKLVATILKDEKDDEVWGGVKTQLQSDGGLKLGPVEQAYKMLYNNLGKSHKKCLLFVTLFPSDHIIHKDNLVEFWNAEGFLATNIPKCIKDTRENGATTLKMLTDNYLLENYSESDKHVKMHVYMRKVAIEQHFPGEEKWLSWLLNQVNNQHNLMVKATWRKTKRLSLIGCTTELPTSPKSCSGISTLLMQNLRTPSNPNDLDHLVKLGDKFFDNMKNLRILDLNETRIESLPKSTTSLVSLICLYLNGCLLTALPKEVNKMKKLEFLDIRGTSICSLPDALGKVTQLRCLRISFSQKKCNHYGENSEVKTTIPTGIISRLKQLEELTIEAGCCNKAWDDIADEIAIEIATLEKLSTLEFHFPGVSSLQEFVNSRKSLENEVEFRSYNISIGCYEKQHPYGLNIPGILADRKLRLSTKEDISSVEELATQAEGCNGEISSNGEVPTDAERGNGEISSIGKVLIQATSFELFGNAVGNLSEFGFENLGSLKVCVVGRSKKMKSIVDVSSTDSTVLQCLEKLHLFELILLEQIWAGQISSGSLANLKVLTLSGCPQITTILNYELAKALSSLEYVKVEKCAEVIQIIGGSDPIPDDVDQFDFLNKVTTIELVKLPKLSTFCEVTFLKLKSLEVIEIEECKAFDLKNLRNVEKITCKIKADRRWWEPVFNNLSKEKVHSTGATFEVGESSKQGGSSD